MIYLKEYNLSDEDLQEIYDSLSDENWYNITTYESRVCDLLDYFKSIGITNFKDIFLTKPNIFYKNAKEMRKYIEDSKEKEQMNTINNDEINNNNEVEKESSQEQQENLEQNR